MLLALRYGAVTLAAAALVLTGTTAAQAQKVGYNDGVADVWDQTPSTTAPGAYDYAPADSPLNADLVRTTAKHGPRNLILTTSYDRLAPRENLLYSLWEIRADSDTTSHHVYVGADARNWTGQSYFYLGAPGPARTAAPRVPTSTRQGLACEGVSHSIDYRADQVTATVPRACLGNPETVKVRSVAFAMVDGESLLVDNGRTDGYRYVEQRWTRKLSAG